jgi:pimeloyl-ACP methyl ester carboxylesterase
VQIVFLHGLESGPQGSKFQALSQRFGDVLAPDCSGIYAVDERLRIIRQELARHRGPFLVVGSSMGGLMALLLQQAEPERIAGLVLCAPALHRDNAPIVDLGQLPPVRVIHGSRDEVVPIRASRIFAERLIKVDDDHRLQHSLPLIVQTVAELIPVCSLRQ